ncbi:hypothetical protein [Hymenobacter properus]|uniref:Uncharacterized protein n=1 Tax=Hymenobacter properus TaxID=2791026 RepID=A0A931BI22_9BACT|nr:hypothetical protein [Hymenobacter properus]MBF9143974.1 hypothetical protein [Hymenobacter properus]MBR7722789.1 hypothetical protein [Microvirga sp. SRT04]
MKAPLLFRLSPLLLVFASTLVQAQTPTPSTAPAGYWNVETNRLTHDYTTVRFYNSQDQLVYEERIDNLCLNLTSNRPVCRRTMAQLNQSLAQVLSNPAAAAQNPTLLAQQFSADRRVQRVYASR